MTNNCIPDVLAPDMIIINGKVVTVDAKFSFAEAIAVKSGRIIAVGDRAEIEALQGKGTKVLDLKGQTIMPGIVDSHVHIPWYAFSLPPYKIDITYPAVKSIADIREAIRAAAAKAKPGDWIMGDGWNQAAIQEIIDDPTRRMCKENFDAVSPNNPVYLLEFSHHNAVVNSAALRAAGIDGRTPDPVGGSYPKGADGEPSGYIVERGIIEFEKVMPTYTREQTKEAFLNCAKTLATLGITSVNTGAETPDAVSIYSEIATDGSLGLRLSLLLMWADYGLGGTLEDFEQAFKYVGTSNSFGNEWCKVSGIKIFGDGIPPAWTAWNYDPYPDGTHGGLVVPGDTDAEKVEHLRAMIKLCNRNRMQIGVHTCGDRAVDVTIDAFIEALEDYSWDARHFTMHGDWIRHETMLKMAKYNIGHSTQTSVKYNICDDMIAVMGEERAGEQWPMKELLAAGVKLCISSDVPCSSPDWRIGIQTAVLREARLSGVVSGPHQCLTVAEAIRAYTMTPAWLDHEEHNKGSIEAGKLADFVVLGQDITACDPHKIMETPILMTIVDGKVVFSDDTLKMN